MCTSASLATVATADAFELFGIKLWGSAEEDDPDLVDPVRYGATLTLKDEDEDLQKRLESSSALIQDVKLPVSGSLGLLTKARNDRERLVAALYASARYDGVVEVLIAGQNIDDLPPDATFDTSSGPVPVTITVDPGLVFTLGQISLQGDAANLQPAQFGLIPGGDAGSEAILKAQAGIVRALKEEGRPLASVTGQNIVANHATTTLDVEFTVAAGPVAGYGPTNVSGTKSMDAGFTEYMVGLTPGKQYSPKEIDDARTRLLALGVFSSVTLKEGTELDAAGNIPIDVEVSERKLRYYGVGATLSNTEGFGVEGYWGHRNLFGRAETIRVEGAINGIGEETDVTKLNYNASVLFEKPGVIGPDSKFFARAATVFEHPDAYDRFSVKGSAGVSYQLTREQSVSAEVALEYSDISDFYNPDGAKHLLASVPLQYVFDNRDNRLDPKTGFRALAFIEPSYDILNGAAFVKVRGEGSAYRALDAAGRFVLAGRVAAGSILGGSLEDVPADRRFYSGGGGSVRGYAYQGIGPKDPDGDPIGGLSFAETSVELRFAVNETFGIVPFIDVGTVSDTQFPTFSDAKMGAGIGIRYLTPFGPLRIDAAIPLNADPGDPSFGIYAGVGQAF